MKAKHQRLLWVSAGMLCAAVGLAIILTTFRDNLLYFYAPKTVTEQTPAINKPFRLGGMVKEASVQQDGLHLRFTVTDYEADIPVYYYGIVPGLFREGQGVVMDGVLDKNGVFQAAELLTKHDENYMPPEVKEAIEPKKMQESLAQ